MIDDDNANDPHEQHDGAQASEASLNEALDDLEGMLGRRRSQPATPDSQQNSAPAQPSSDNPYTIPLLDEVVIPGEAPDGATGGFMGRSPDDMTLPPTLCTRLAERLASEIEVIMLARLEGALRDAGTEIRRQVRSHIEIVLPEIIDELSRDSDDFADE